jgi:hypothetical protein
MHANQAAHHRIDEFILSWKITILKITKFTYNRKKSVSKSLLVNILLGLAVFGSSGSGFGRSKHL